MPEDPNLNKVSTANENGTPFCNHCPKEIGRVKLSLVMIMLFNTTLFAQTVLLPLDHGLNNRIGKLLYSTSSNVHTSSFPLELSRLHLADNLDSLLLIGRHYSGQYSTWLERKIFSEHLAEIRNEDFSLTLDFVPDLSIGSDATNDALIWKNIRAVQMEGIIGRTFSFRMQYFESQAKFPSYLVDYIRNRNVVPGAGYRRMDSPGIYDLSYSVGSFVYSPNEYLTIEAGHGKNFIGDGYRSMLLSDVGYYYPFFKITGYVWDLQYAVMWSQFQDLSSSARYKDISWFNKKYGVFHYLDWNIDKNISIGFFESIIWRNDDTLHGYRGFEVQYLNPFVILRPVDFSMGSPDNVVLGINAKYKISDSNVLYGQFVLDEMTFSEYFKGTGWWGNKNAYQIGVKSFLPFGCKDMFLQFELNAASPYTYSHISSVTNYGHYNQSLAHPVGANFYEAVTIGSYMWGRFEVRLELNYITFGDDSTGVNFGGDIFKPYTSRMRDYGNYISQGITSDRFIGDLRLAYILNPKTDLRFECEAQFRSSASFVRKDQDFIISVGIRSAMHNLYSDY